MIVLSLANLLVGQLQAVAKRRRAAFLRNSSGLGLGAGFAAARETRIQASAERAQHGAAREDQADIGSDRRAGKVHLISPVEDVHVGVGVVRGQLIHVAGAVYGRRLFQARNQDRAHHERSAPGSRPRRPAPAVRKIHRLEARRASIRCHSPGMNSGARLRTSGSAARYS